MSVHNATLHLYELLKCSYLIKNMMFKVGNILHHMNNLDKLVYSMKSFAYMNCCKQFNVYSLQFKN